MKNLRINEQRLWNSIMEMAEIGATAKGGSCRLALTDEDKAGRDLFAKWCTEAGCSIEVDRLGNMFARREGTTASRDPIATGSHLDTQPKGGKFDGIFGVLAGLEVIRTLNDHGLSTDAPIEVINWTNEEGTRFAPAMLSSGVYAGLFELDFALNQTDETGASLAEELKRIGYQGDRPCGEHALGALFEAHIEQGPILEKQGDTIGVVRGGQGQRWYDVTVTGRDAHTGSTPMVGRRDALVAGAKLVEGIEQIALDFAPDAVATVGSLNVSPNSRNTIPGEVTLTVDMRNPDDDTLAAMAGRLVELLDDVRESRSVVIDSQEIWHNPPVKFDEHCIDAVREATRMLGLPHREMVSGAGHDACQVARVVPTSMIFVPCAEGLSHNEEESATAEDLGAGCNVLLHAMLKMADAKAEA
jgi:beta-ureidopropionase / N-carbamoyl-L-amino-acid hydrolase